MKGTAIKSSRQMGVNINERKSRLKPRLGPGEKLSKPVAPGPRATENVMNKFLHNLDSCEKKDFLTTTTRFMFLAALLFCINARTEAVPVFDREIEFELPCIDNCAANANLFMNNSILNRYPWWVSTSVKDASNVEWIPAQEFRYSAIEKVLYNFLGGSYEPGSIGCPFQRNMKYIFIPVEESQDEQNTDIQVNLNKFSYSPGINEGGTFPSSNLTYNSILTNRQDASRFDIHAVPEPSSILIFSIMTFGYLWMKNRSS